MDEYLHPLIGAIIIAGVQTNAEHWYWNEIFHKSLQSLLQGSREVPAWNAVRDAETIADYAVLARRRHELALVAP